MNSEVAYLGCDTRVLRQMDCRFDSIIGGKPMTDNTAFIGLDTHKERVAVAIAEDGRGEVRYYGQIANEPAAALKLVKKLAGTYDKLFFCYEAGPCGYGLQRHIT